MSPPAYRTFNPGQQETRIVRDSVREDDLDIVDVADLLIWRAPDDLQISLFAYGDGACSILDAEKRRSAKCSHTNGLKRAESNSHDLFDAVMVGNSGHASLAQRIGVRAQYEPAACASESKRELSCQLHVPSRRRSVRLLAIVPLPARWMQKFDLSRRQRQVCSCRCNCQNDISLNQQPNEILRTKSLEIRPEIIFRKAGAWPEPVFEIVDAELGGVAACHRPEMSGYGKSELVGLIDNRSQRIP